jgi:ribosomal-protein-alanine N-acetyltransferase
MIKKQHFLLCALMTLLNNSLYPVANFSTTFKPIETERLIIRAIEQLDADDCFQIFSDQEIHLLMALPFHENIEQTSQFIKKTHHDYIDNNFAWFAVVEKSSNKTIGMLVFDDYSPKFCKTGLAYVFAKDFWGKGYAFEASKALVDFGFESMGLNRIYATVDPENLRSERVLEKLGMQYEGYLRQEVRCQGTFKDRKLYAILKEDWIIQKQ